MWCFHKDKRVRLTVISELGVAEISQSLGTSRDKTGLVFFKVIIVFVENYANYRIIFTKEGCLLSVRTHTRYVFIIYIARLA